VVVLFFLLFLSFLPLIFLFFFLGLAFLFSNSEEALQLVGQVADELFIEIFHDVPIQRPNVLLLLGAFQRLRARVASA